MREKGRRRKGEGGGRKEGGEGGGKEREREEVSEYCPVTEQV